jgi:hypothetical protein
MKAFSIPFLLVSGGLVVVSASSACTVKSAAPATPAADAGPGPGPGPADTGPAPEAIATTPEAYDLAMASAICQQLQGCCNTEEYEGYFASAYTNDPYDWSTKNDAGIASPKPAPEGTECAPVLARQLGLLHTGKWGASIEAGRMKFDAAAGARCINAVRTATCGADTAKAIFDNDCFDKIRSKVFVRAGKVGDACNGLGDGSFGIGDCDPNVAFCNEKKVCTAWRVAGDSCGATKTLLLCKRGFDCIIKDFAKGGECLEEPQKKLGEDCKISDLDLISSCEAGSYCDNDRVGATYKCVPADNAAGE